MSLLKKNVRMEKQRASAPSAQANSPKQQLQDLSSLLQLIRSRKQVLQLH
jgi:hypothetical protein